MPVEFNCLPSEISRRALQACQSTLTPHIDDTRSGIDHKPRLRIYPFIASKFKSILSLVSR